MWGAGGTDPHLCLEDRQDLMDRGEASLSGRTDQVIEPDEDMPHGPPWCLCLLSPIDEGMTESPVETLEKAIVLHHFWTEILTSF